MKEYKTARGWAIFIYLTAPLLIGLFGWLLLLPFADGDFTPDAGWILIPVSIAMIVLMIVGVIDTYKGRLLISDDKISSISTFSYRELRLNEVKGYTVNDNYIFLEPANKDQKRIKISRYIGGYNEILSWVSKTFTDLESQSATEEEQAILNNDSYGLTKDDREEKLIIARRNSRITNWTGGIVFAWAFFMPQPYQYAILVAMVVPIVAILVVKFSNGLIRIDERKGSPYPSVAYALLFPSIVLMLRALKDYNIFDYTNVWLPIVVIAIALLALLLVSQKELTFKKVNDYLIITLFTFVFLGYSYGVVIHFNCYYDTSDAEYYTAEVLNKRISSGKTTTRYLELSTWGQQKETDEVSVGKALYNNVEVGDEVSIYFSKGKFEIPWFFVTEE